MRISDAIAAEHQAWERHTDDQQPALSYSEDPVDRLWPSVMARLLDRLKKPEKE